MFLFEKVSVLGAGLLGGSLACALKKRRIAEKISTWSRSGASRLKCSQMPEIFDEVCEEPELSVDNADLIVICTPTESIPQVLERVAPRLKKGAMVSDVGSVKKNICVSCEKILENQNAVFVGSHPMAGSEKIGVENSDESIFEGKACFITPSSRSEAEIAAKILSQMWRLLGMDVYCVSAEAHDSIVARISHLPHLASGLLCELAENFKTPYGDIRRFAGSGFRDCSRVSSGNPEVWLSIVRDNKNEILKALKEYLSFASDLQKAVENSDDALILKFLEEAKTFRDALGDFSNLK